MILRKTLYLNLGLVLFLGSCRESFDKIIPSGSSVWWIDLMESAIIKAKNGYSQLV